MKGISSWHYAGGPATHYQAQIMTSELLLLVTAELWGLGGIAGLLSLSYSALETADMRDSKSWDSHGVLRTLESFLLNILFWAPGSKYRSGAQGSLGTRNRASGFSTDCKSLTCTWTEPSLCSLD